MCKNIPRWKLSDGCCQPLFFRRQWWSHCRSLHSRVTFQKSFLTRGIELKNRNRSDDFVPILRNIHLEIWRFIDVRNALCVVILYVLGYQNLRCISDMYFASWYVLIYHVQYFLSLNERWSELLIFLLKDVCIGLYTCGLLAMQCNKVSNVNS